MLWIIVLVALAAGVHHIVKYLLPVLRVTSDGDAWDEFNSGRSDWDTAVRRAGSRRSGPR